MSGLEIAGLVSGIIPLLQLAFDATKALKKRYEDVRMNTRKIAAIETTLNTISQQLQQLHLQYGNHQLRIPPQNASIIETDFNDLAATLHQIAESFANVSRHDQSRPSRRRDLINIFSIVVNNKRTSICNDLLTQLDTASDRLRHINHLLVTVTTTQSISETQDDIIDQLQSLGKLNTNAFTGRDAYTPSFYVPTNPPLAKECLDYVSVDSEGNALTSEGKLKATLLHLVNKRKQSHHTLPIVGAVGMSGTGKTCALRGLKAERDLRQLFRDGILYLFCGPSASNEDIKQALCSIVSQTGGRALSKEIKELAGKNAIDAIIEKVSAWFKHRKCLFLIDDIWNTTATGFSFLARLSTVVENCDTTSGLVYTTRDEKIDTIGVAVRFGWLKPDDPTCCNILARAAGFSQEQIDQTNQRRAFDMILDHCKGLKISLVIAGAQVRLRATRYGEHKAQAWASYAIALRDSPRQLLTQDYGEYRSLHHQFTVSLETLSSQESHKFSFHMPYRIEELFQALSVAEKGVVLHDSMLYRLWGLESIHQAREVSKLFADSSLVETTFEFLDERYSEGIVVHDLVHDYASYLSNQKYADRNWIKGWEIWGLRLIERYFGTDANVVSDSSSFSEWWKNDDVSRQYDSQDHLQDVISRMAHSSQIRSGQSLLRHNVGVDRWFDKSESADLPSVGVCFTLSKSTIVEMHEFVTILARERNVELSAMTLRLLVFAALLHLRMDRLLETNQSAGERAEEYYNHFSSGTNVKRQGPLRTTDLTQLDESNEESAFREQLVIHIYIIPKDLGEYLQSSVALNWAFYDNCIECMESDDDELYRMLGIPLTFEKLKEAGIEGVVLLCLDIYPSGCFKSGPIVRRREVDNAFVFKKTYDCIYITTPFFQTDDLESIKDHQNRARHLCLHLHEVEITQGEYFLSHRKRKAIGGAWFDVPPSSLRYVRTQSDEPESEGFKTLSSSESDTVVTSDCTANKLTTAN